MPRANFKFDTLLIAEIIGIIRDIDIRNKRSVRI